ncbi:MAG: 7TM diverse intracellular signaling domain-containing protein [Burkholderiaceae bacterium]
MQAFLSSLRGPWRLAERIARIFACLAALLLFAAPVHALPGRNVTLDTHYWVDTRGLATIDEVAAMPPETFRRLDKPRAFDLGRGALWLRYDLPALDAQRRWHLLMEGPSYTNRAALYQLNAVGQWRTEQAGDHIPMSQWTHPDLSPTFEVDARAFAPAARTVWLRVENYPTTLNPGLSLLDGDQLESRRNSSLIFLGAYLGFGLLVMFLGFIHVRLYADKAFIPYMGYVFCMLGFQVSFTGLGALSFWPEWNRWNDAAPALFVAWLTASGIWFVRHVCALHRLSRPLNRFVVRWSQFGFIFPAFYIAFMSPAAFKILNLYGLLSVLLSVALCLWAWRKGETYAGWMALGFAPLHLAYPFAALRAAGILSDSWVTQYAVLIGSAIEIPLLLYILHRRAKDFYENRARLRALDSTDPLTGLPILPVLLLRLGDALKRARRGRGNCGLALVELANYHELVAQEGRQVGDRALVIAASQLTSIVRDVDTVCRVSGQRFAVLLESAWRAELLQTVAQHVVARGLSQTPSLPPHQSLRYRVVTIALPDPSMSPEEEQDVKRFIARLDEALDQLDPKRVVYHLPPAGAPAVTQPVPAVERIMAK